MDESARTAALEATHGPYRVYIEGALVRGYWSQEDAHDAARGFAHKGRPASVWYTGTKVNPHLDNNRSKW